MMKWVSKSDGDTDKRFIIEEEDGVGFYLYVFTGGNCTRDYLQDSLDLAIGQAERDFGVLRETWQLVDS